ncbi:GlcG/HbpS family heme-binding protein [Pedobacter jamesrossensis]|uniref:Heme-binding protein n=1 Tax=Pedobacter jamesrossensis TaxID=1908238 RepID=A0ABV8NMR1_9SPHI
MIIKKFIVYIFITVPISALAQEANHNKKDFARQEPHAVSINPYLTTKSRLTLKAAYALAEVARAKATAMGKQVSIAILDESGITISITRGDDVGPHNTEAARRKAYTALSTKTRTLTLARNAKKSSDSENLAFLPELLLLGGGVPLWYGDLIVGSIGVAGGGSAENDDLIARSAVLPIADITVKEN